MKQAVAHLQRSLGHLPTPSLAGVPHLFSSFADYKRAIAIADSPNIGVCLCCGTWLEGGPRMGADPVEVIKYFAPQKKLFKIHFRNVTAPLRISPKP
jgi:mannonate dehydratase